MRRKSSRFAGPVMLLLTASAVLLTAASPSNQKVTRYLIVSGDSSSGSWDSRDEGRMEKWRAQYGREFAWFRQDGRDYIVSDSRILAEMQKAMAPQREVNRQQDEVNRHQDAVNRLQDGVNRHQEDVNRQQSLVNASSEVQDRLNQRQSEVNGKQAIVNAEQQKVNRQQEGVNKEQEVVNRNQESATVEVNRALQAVFDEARQQGLAHEVR